MSDSAVQFVDDTSQFTNSLGCGITDYVHDIRTNTATLFSNAQSNITTWNDLIWISGGKLNPGKCYFYSFHPSFDHKRHRMSYHQLEPSTPLHLIDKDNQTRI